MKKLNHYRNNPQNWQELAYQKAHSEKWGDHDANQNARFEVLTELQYDSRKEDEKLIRFLFEQEIIARENDSFQGIGDALWLGAYLLAKYKKAEDIPLFYRAKFANFDTGCGFDREFIYLALREKTEGYVQQNFPELFEKIKGDYVELDLENRLDTWWEKLSKRFPADESTEALFSLYTRQLELGHIEQAKELLKKWEAVEPDSDEKTSKLRFEYTELQDYPEAIKYALEELKTKEGNWDRASFLQRTLKLYTQIEAPKEGLEIIQQIDQEFSLFDDWTDVNLGRFAIHETFEYALMTPDLETARQAFQIAHGWFQKVDGIYPDGLKAGWKAAEKCSFTKEAAIYKERVEKEEN